VKIKVKRQIYNGKPALTIILSDTTKKIIAKVEAMKALEFQQQA
jgi:23S rRNA maturation-related 3'-5' exoribonuclease YhaM